jgi:hypothetical protein
LCSSPQFPSRIEFYRANDGFSPPLPAVDPGCERLEAGTRYRSGRVSVSEGTERAREAVQTLQSTKHDSANPASTTCITLTHGALPNALASWNDRFSNGEEFSALPPWRPMAQNVHSLCRQHPSKAQLTPHLESSPLLNSFRDAEHFVDTVKAEACVHVVSDWKP